MRIITFHLTDDIISIIDAMVASGEYGTSSRAELVRRILPIGIVSLIRENLFLNREYEQLKTKADPIIANKYDIPDEILTDTLESADKWIKKLEELEN